MQFLSSRGVARDAPLRMVWAPSRRDAGQHPAVARWVRRLWRKRGQPGVAAMTVDQVQDRLRGHRLRPETVLAAFARRRDVGDQRADGVGRLAALGRQFVIVDAQRIRPPRRRSRLVRRTAM